VQDDEIARRVLAAKLKKAYQEGKEQGTSFVKPANINADGRYELDWNAHLNLLSKNSEQFKFGFNAHRPIERLTPEVSATEKLKMAGLFFGKVNIERTS
jgi:hypothetical protein